VEPAFRSIVQDPNLTALEKLHRYFEMSTYWKTSNMALLMELVEIWYSDENALARQKMLASTVEHLGPFFTEIINQGVREGVFTTPYPEIASQVTINLIYDLAYTSGQMLVADHSNSVHSNSVEAMHSDTLQRAETLFAAYSDALERVLGAPKGSIHLMAAEALKVWFSPDSEKFI
jgi:hypothetical protein